MLASLLATPARAEQDPWSTAVRGLSKTPFATFQGVDCVSIHAPRSIVWRLLVAPEYAAAWFFADSPRLKPRGGRYKHGPTAETGDVLSLEATTSEGPRHLELSVIVAAPPGLLSFLVRSDEAGILDKGIEQASFTFGLKSPSDGATDVYLVSHYDSNSPFAAILSQVAAHHQHDRRLAILADAPSPCGGSRASQGPASPRGRPLGAASSCLQDPVFPQVRGGAGPIEPGSRPTALAGASAFSCPRG